MTETPAAPPASTATTTTADPPPAPPAAPPALPDPAAALAGLGDGDQGDDGGGESRRPPRSGWETAGTVLVAVGIGAGVVVLIDIASKGKLLGPLIAHFAGPRPAEAPPAEAAAEAAELVDEPDGE